MELTQEQRKELLALSADHEGHARATLLLYPKFRHNSSYGWLYYNGRFWQREGAAAAVERAVTNTLAIRRQLALDADDRRLLNKSWGDRPNVTGAREQIKKSAVVVTSVSDFDADPDVINCNNGSVNLRTGVLTPHNSSQLFTYCLPIDYNPDADAAEWLAFLQSVGFDDEMIDYLRLAVGYTLTGHTSEEILFYLYGRPRSGKGTFTETVNTVIDTLGAGVNFRSFTAERHGDTSNFDLAPLKAKRYITASESSRYKMLNPSVIKQITGGDEIYCSFKRKDHFSYRPQFKIWLTSNWPVNTDVDDDAAWGRVRVIEFPNSFLGREDKGLKARLKSAANLQAVLMWAVSGARDWYARGVSGLPLPQQIVNVTQQQRESADSIGMFLQECCTLVDGEFSNGGDFYAEYKRWCEDEEYRPRGRRGFTQSLDVRGITSGVKRLGSKTARGYFGVKFGKEAPIYLNGATD